MVKPTLAFKRLLSACETPMFAEILVQKWFREMLDKKIEHHKECDRVKIGRSRSGLSKPKRAEQGTLMNLYRISFEWPLFFIEIP